MHKRPVPRIGGVAIVTAVAICAFIWVDMTGPWRGIMAGFLLAAAIGFVDDVRGIPPSIKMGAIVAVACIPVIGYDVTFNHVTLPLIGDHDLGWVAYPITILWIAAVANLVNLIDGMDGLAAGIVAHRGLLVRDPRRLVRTRERGGAVRDRVRRDARLPGLQLPPGERSSWATRGRSRSASCWRRSRCRAS